MIQSTRILWGIVPWRTDCGNASNRPPLLASAPQLSKERIMSQDSEKYHYFTVGLLKDSFALEALEADALKHHMIDQPAKLIALRLTEYYDLLTRVAPTVPGASLFAAKNPNLGTRAMTDYLTGGVGESADEPVEE